MKAFIASLLFLALLGIRAPASFAQQNQNYQKLVQEIEALKTELSAVQSQLQTVENTEKMKLLTDLADAKTKLADANVKLINKELKVYTAAHLCYLVNVLSWIPTQETYEGLTTFLNRLLSVPIELKDMLLTATIPSIAWVSHQLNKEDWISPLKTSISHLDNEPDTIKKILHRRLPDDMPNADDLSEFLLELLERHDPKFVSDYREQKANTNTEAT